MQYLTGVRFVLVTLYCLLSINIRLKANTAFSFSFIFFPFFFFNFLYIPSPPHSFVFFFLILFLFFFSNSTSCVPSSDAICRRRPKDRERFTKQTFSYLTSRSIGGARPVAVCLDDPQKTITKQIDARPQSAVQYSSHLSCPLP